MRQLIRWVTAATAVGSILLVSGCVYIERIRDFPAIVIFGFLFMLLWLVYAAFESLKHTDRFEHWLTAWRGYRAYRAALRRIRKVSQARVQAAVDIPEPGATPIDKAVRDRSVRVSSVKGNGLEHVEVSLEPTKTESSQRICFPLGLVFLSNGGHQNMAVREPQVKTIVKPTECSIPVTCINFHKPVPSSRDSFESLAQASFDVKKVLAVARATGMSPFVTQLATWIVTDGVDPSLDFHGTLFT